MTGWGGSRPGAGKKKQNPANRPRLEARPRLVRPEPKLTSPRPAEVATVDAGPAIDPQTWMEILPQVEAISKAYAKNKARTSQNSPFRLPKFPKAALPPENVTMAMDSALCDNLSFANQDWLAGEVINGVTGEGLLFLGYSYLSELAQRPEYRVMAETIADDATRKWIDFDVVGDAKTEREKRAKDPAGYDERMADPDERQKRLKAEGKLDKVKAMRDDQLRLCVKDRIYEQCRNDGFFGRSHLFLDIHTNGPTSEDELKMSIGDGRDSISKSKVPKGSFKDLRTIEPVWTYPLNYNANDPLAESWYNPQVWYVMGKEIHGSRLQTFIGHPVPDMLKPAYAFGGLSLTQMAKPYVDIWLQTRQSVADLIHSFSVMCLMTDLSTLMQPGNVGALLARAAMFNMLRDNNGVFVVNKNTEDFKNVSASLSGLHELQSQAQEHMASVHRIPLVKFTGIQPAGLNASSEGEIKVYDDTIMAYQSRFIAPNLTKIINFEQLSLFGEIDPAITYKFMPLREMTQAEKGQKEKDDADRNQKYVDMGALHPAEVRAVIINDPDLPYTELDPDDVPDLLDEEQAGLEPVGGRPQIGGGEGDGGDGGGANDAAVPFDDDEFDILDVEEIEPGVFVAILAQDEARFEESKHPRDQDGKFTDGSGGGGGGSPEKPTFKSKKDHIGHLLSKGTTPKEVMKEMGWPSVSMPQQAAALFMKLEKYKEDGVTKYKGVPMSDAERDEAKAAAAAKRAAKSPGRKDGKRGRAAADPETWSLFEFLASQGGLKPTADLRSIFGSKRGPFVPGFGPLLRPDGMDLDQALTKAKENSYVLDPNDIQHVQGIENHNENTVRWQDLQDMIDEESRGRKQYRLTHTPAESKVDTEEEARHIVDALHREVRAAGGTVDPALEDRVVQIIQMEGEHDVLAAYERAIMEDHDRYEDALDDRRDAGYETEGWDFPDDIFPDATPGDGENAPAERR